MQSLELSKAKSFVRFIVFFALITILVPILLIFLPATSSGRPVLVATPEQRDYLWDGYKFQFSLFALPIFVAGMILGYPLWRLVVNGLSRIKLPWRLGVIFGGALVAIVPILLPFLLLGLIAGFAELEDSYALIVFLVQVYAVLGAVLGFLLFGRLAPVVIDHDQVFR